MQRPRHQTPANNNPMSTEAETISEHRPHRRQRTHRQIGATITLAFMLSAGCTPVDDTTTTPQPNDRTQTSEPALPDRRTTPSDNTNVRTFTNKLETAADCPTLLQTIKDRARNHIGPYGLNINQPFNQPFNQVFEQSANRFDTPDSAETGNSQPAASVDLTATHSNTNTAEQGIDEGDIVKTDGTRIYIAKANQIIILDVTDPDNVTRATVELAPELWVTEMIITDDRILAFSESNTQPSVLQQTEGDGGVSSDIAPQPGTTTPTTTITDIATTTTGPDVAGAVTFTGTYKSVRIVNNQAHIVMTATTAPLPFVYPSNPAAKEVAHKTNVETFENTTVEDWLPSFTYTTADGNTTKQTTVACEQVHIPTTYAGTGTTTVLTVPLDQPLAEPDKNTVTVMTSTNLVYASQDNIYVTTENIMSAAPFTAATNQPDVKTPDIEQPDVENQTTTTIHRFELPDTTDGAPRAPIYKATGNVQGQLLNDLALSEHNNHLRVATTTGSPWADTDSESRITVLRADDTTMNEVGKVTDLGKGERIYAARFIGPTAYIVTFRQTDPFYIIDLSDPTNPTTRGELKILGYSGYLHQTNEGRILGIGQDGTEDGTLTGLKATLFDTTDPNNPKTTTTWTYGADGSYTSVEHDRKAFLWWEPARLAFIPVNDWTTGFHGIVALHVTDTSITEAGRISHNNISTPDSRCTPWWHTIIDIWSTTDLPNIENRCGNTQPTQPWENTQWVPPVERTIVIGTTVWTISATTVQGNNLDDFTTRTTIDLTNTP